MFVIFAAGYHFFVSSSSSCIMFYIEILTKNLMYCLFQTPTLPGGQEKAVVIDIGKINLSHLYLTDILLN